MSTAKNPLALASTSPLPEARTSTQNLPATSPQQNAAQTNNWTPQRQVTFLRALASSQSVTAAAREAGMSRQSAYNLRTRLKGEPFDAAWIAALRCRFDTLAELALERAMHGVEVPHYYKGELVGTSRKYDERLTVALLAMKAKFKPAFQTIIHPASAYGADDLGRLLERIEEGPETWSEEIRLADEAYDEEYGEDAPEDWELE